MKRAWEDQECNFCCKKREEVGHLIRREDGGPTICNECIAMCVEMSSKEMHRDRDRAIRLKRDLEEARMERGVEAAARSKAEKKLTRIERICYSVLKWAQAEENKTATHAEANVMQAAMLAAVGMVVWEQEEGKTGPNPVQQYGDKLAKENVRLEEIVKGSCQACGDCDPHRIGKWGY